MNGGIRRPAAAPPPVRMAGVRAADPSACLADHYRQVWQTQMRDLPFVNPALHVEAIGFVRHAGDWLGVVVTPWFLNLFLLNGGGGLWRDIPAGQRRTVELPCGALQFIADDDPAIGSYQYCPLIAPVTAIPDMGAARQAASDALHAALTLPAQAAAPMPAATAEPARRGFLRRLAGRSG
ncbi:MAG: [NiFe]-hydrogenase assembly chaperone HybE [Desulfobulbus sp.]|nr:[NiFe]-hydrogenase assembly chaperone HybE [Desulfobulbus sp.]